MSPIKGVLNREGPFTWHAIVYDLTANDHSEEDLLALVRYTGRLSLAPGCETPHSLSPEDMLRSLATQKLIRLTRHKYLQEIWQAVESGNADNYASLKGITEASFKRWNDE